MYDSIDGGTLSPAVVTANRLAPRSFGSDANVPKYSQSQIVGAKIGSALSAILGTYNPLLGLILSAGTSLYAQNMQNEFTQRANEEARRQALLDRTHDEFYNSPAMQKLRLKEAGLSPADFISGFETSSREFPVQIPDQSYLAQAGQAGVTGLLNMQSYRDENRKIGATVRLLEAQAYEAKVNAEFARHKQELDIAGKEYANSLLAKQVDSYEKTVENLDLDIEAKRIANSISNATRDLAIQIKGQEFRGLKLSNDFKELEIKGKKYEIDYLLPAQLRSYNDKHELDKQNLYLLGLSAGIMETDYLKSVAEHSVIEQNLEEYIQTLMYRLNCDHETARISAKYAMLNFLMGKGISLVGAVSSLASKLL